MPGVRLDVEAREVIALGLARGESLREIGRRLGRPASTVSREVMLAGGRDGYRATVAQRGSSARARRPKVRKLVAVGRLAVVVEAGLVKRWSPAEIAARLKVDFAGDVEMRVSHETIYASLYLQGKGGLKNESIRR